MEDTIVTLRFTEVGNARRALHELKRLDRDGRLRVREAALIQRSGQGEIGVPAAAQDDDGFYMPPGEVISMLLEVLGARRRRRASRRAGGRRHDRARVGERSSSTLRDSVGVRDDPGPG